MRIRRVTFAQAQRAWESRALEPPDTSKEEAWRDHLESLSDEDLILTGEQSDEWGLNKTCTDPDWREEMGRRNLDY